MNATSPPSPSRASSATRRWVYAPLLFGLLASTVTHGTAAIAMILRGAGSTGGSRGENGHTGGGDTDIDVSLAGPESTAAETAVAPPPTATATATVPPAIATAATATPTDTSSPTELTAPAETATATPKDPVSSIFLTPPIAGGGGMITNGGRIAGPSLGAGITGINGNTIEGQRALLPRAATCKDPIAGTWEAHKYNPQLGGIWVHFTLSVHRGAAGVLTGPILSHTWSGDPGDSIPPECRAGAINMTVSMNATGTDGGNGRISFGASHYSVVSIECRGFTTDYSPDHFSGTIDPQRQEFQSVNNDGMNDINAPYVFRRTGCLDQ